MLINWDYLSTTPKTRIQILVKTSCAAVLGSECICDRRSKMLSKRCFRLGMDSSTQKSSSAEQKARSARLLNLIFGVPKDIHLEDFSCALYHGPVPRQGRLYLTTTNHLYFFSSVFGSEVRLSIPLSRATSVSKQQALLMVQAVRVEYWDADGRPAVAVFGSFASNGRDLAFGACLQALYRARPGMRPAPKH